MHRVTLRRGVLLGDAARGLVRGVVVSGCLAGLVLTGCAVGPDYHRPATPVDAHYTNVVQPGVAEDVAVERYWTRFEDPLLDSLVDDALHHNKDLATAAANLRAARAVRRLAGFDQYPTATFSGGYTHNLEAAQQLPGGDQHDREFDTADAGFDM